ncbi:hypothetical protein [Thorsellia anophelis]|uniref:Uncharacterized protein n=1 Tax=Thorsellia anophelis DSM 18579 TaxID=1123402 RepID=A0A1H9Z7P6_9GAMM|nr:hypothetical protein [Thorsellia anophelis]SES77569.1 hypothetical protein SAMN02583745_00461 [Thorsellia anophelis DSM 18579]
MKIKFQKQNINPIAIFSFILLSMGLHSDVYAEIMSKKIEQKPIRGYYPYMQSVGAKLLTEVHDSETNTTHYFPWTLNEDSSVRIPTVGSIAYVPDIFCSVLPSDMVAAKENTSLAPFFNHFNFVDLDLDPCDSTIGTGISVKWYMLDNITPWTDSLKWEELNPIEIPEEYVIKAGSEVAKKYQNKHNFPPLREKAISLNTLDAVEIPTAALGKRIGFTLQVKSKYGLPVNGMPLQVWDLSKYFAQNPPSQSGDIIEENIGFILGDNPTEQADGTAPSTTGGVVQLGRPPYVRSIGALYASNGTMIGYHGNQFRTLAIEYTGEHAVDGGLPESRPRQGAVAYIPDAFCQFRNQDIETYEQLDNLAEQLNFPALKVPLEDNKAKLKYFRPYFWIADADGDSCDISSDQIEWFVVEPKSEKFAAFKQKVADLIESGEMTNALIGLLGYESEFIWNEVKSWDDVQVVDNISFEVIKPGQGGLYNFDAIGGNFLSAIKLEYGPGSFQKIAHLARPAFIFTPKTKSGHPDTGRQIKVPFVASKLWGQYPSTRPLTLEDAAPDSDFIQNNPSGSGELISSYPQLVNANNPLFPEASRRDFFTLNTVIKPAFVNFDCLLDPKTLPVRDCKMPIPKPIPPIGANIATRFMQVFLNTDALGMRQDKNGLSQEPTISALWLTGLLGKDEVIEVHYVYEPDSSNDPESNLNQSVYEFAPLGQAIGKLSPASQTAGENRIIGHNSFKLRPLTEEDLGQVMEVGILALNGYGIGSNTYSVSLESLASVSLPQIENLSIDADTSVITTGTELTGRYIFTPSNSTVQNEDASLYFWGKDEPENNDFEGITVTQSGITGSYIVSTDDIGQQITLSVRAKDKNNRIGNRLTQSVSPIIPTPTVSNLVIESSNEVRLPSYRSTLTAKYDFDSNIPNDPTDKSTYAFWIDETLVASQTKTYQFTSADLGKVITFKITPINALDFAGSEIQANYVLNSAPPTAKNTRIINATTSYSPFFFGMLSANYEYQPGISTNANEDLTHDMRYLWSGGNANINTRNYVFGPTDIGRVITLSVTPRDLAGQTGQADTATFTMPVPPSIEDLTIRTDVISHSPYQVILDANYTYVPSTTDKPNDNSTYAWTGLTSPAEGSITNESDSGHIAPVALSLSDAGNLITLSMTPRDGNLWLGETKTATTRAPTQQLPPKIDNLKLENKDEQHGAFFYVNDTIIAKYDFTPSSMDNRDASSYLWKATSGNQLGTVQGPIEFTIQTSDAGQVIELEMIAKDGLGNIGNEANAATNTVVMPPSVSNIKITPINTSTNPWNVSVEGSYTFIEGISSNPNNNSTYSWTGIASEQINRPTPIADGTIADRTISLPPLTINHTDAGKTLTLTIHPRDLAGIVGQSESATYLIPAPTIIKPEISNLTITNLSAPNTNRYLPNHILSATYDFKPGSESNEDRSLFSWVANRGVTSGIIGSNPLRFTIQADDIGQLIRLEMIAKDAAGIEGNFSQSVIGSMVNQSPTIDSVSIKFNVPGSLMLSGTYVYKPGVSADNADASMYRWLVGGLPVADFKPVTTVGSVSGEDAYQVTQSDVGKLIRLEILAKDASELEGQTLLSNTLFYQALSVDTLSIAGDPIENQSLRANATFTFGNNRVNRSSATWLKDNTEDRVLAFDAPYPLSAQDVGKIIGLQVTAIDGNDIIGNQKFANNTTAVRPAFTPPFVDGVTISYANSREILLPTHRLTGSYTTFIEGSIRGDNSIYTWLSADTVRLRGSVGPARSIEPYTIGINDVGNIITLRVTARDGSNNEGNTAQDQSIVVIQAPTVSNPIITLNGNPADKLLVSNQLSGRYDFRTGRPNATDASIVTWYANDVQKQQSRITQSGLAPAFNLSQDYVGQYIKLEITAADSANTPGGNTVSVISANTVESNAPSIDSLVISANFEQSAVMTATYLYKPGSSANPADASRYEWLADDQTVQTGLLVGTNQVNGINAYTVLSKDTGKTLRLKITPIDRSGVEGTPIYSTNSLTYQAPSIKVNRITGNGEPNTPLVADYSFTPGSNRNDTSLIRWRIISGQTVRVVEGNSFTPTDADLGKTIFVIATAKDGNQITGNTDEFANSITVAENWPEANFIQIMTASSAVKPTGQWVEYDYVNPNVPGNTPDTTESYRVDFVNPMTKAVVSSRTFPVQAGHHDNAVQGSWQGGRDWYYGYEQYTVCVYVKTTDQNARVIQKGKKCFAPPHYYGYRRN